MLSCPSASGLGLLARTGNVIEQPLELETTEVGRQRQARGRPKTILTAVAREARDEPIHARVLPDEM